MNHYYLGPWQWRTVPTPAWQPPEGFSGLDLRTLDQQAQAGGAPGLGLFVGPATLSGSDYLHVGSGSFYDIKPSQAFKDALPKRSDYSLQGDDLVGILLDLLTNGADPTGAECAKPLTPGTDGRCLLTFGQKHYQRFRWGKGHFSHVRDILRSDLKAIIVEGRAEAALFRAIAAAISGKTWNQVANSSDPVILDNRRLLLAIRSRGLTVAQAVTFLGNRAERVERQYRKVLDFTLEKYRVDKANWQDLCPQDMLGELDPPEPHETLVSDDFNRANNTDLGADWTEVSGDWEITSNVIQEAGGSARFLRHNTDLSSSDNYGQVKVAALASGTSDLWGGVLARMSGSAATGYLSFFYQFNDNIYLEKLVGGTETALTNTGVTLSIPGTVKVECNGSAIKAYQDGVERLSITDSAISSGLRGGIGSYYSFPRPQFDDFEAADLVADAGIIYTQLERTTRGVLRGVYTGFE